MSMLACRTLQMCVTSQCRRCRNLLVCVTVLKTNEACHSACLRVYWCLSCVVLSLPICPAKIQVPTHRTALLDIICA